MSDDVLDAYRVSAFRFVLGMSKFQLRGEPVYFWAAPEPEDVKWENLGYTTWQRVFRVVGNWFVTIIILGICLIANVFISEANVPLAMTHRDRTIMPRRKTAIRQELDST